MPNDHAPASDDRWGDHIPWSLRYPVLSSKGDYKKFLMMMSERLYHLILYNEPHIPNLSQFGGRLASESLMRYRHDSEPAFAIRLKNYFSPDTLDNEASARSSGDAEVKAVHNLQHAYNQVALPGRSHKPLAAQMLHQQLEQAQLKELSTRRARITNHWHQLLPDRFEVLQSLLRLLAKQENRDGLKLLLSDIRRFAAESGVQFDIKGDPPEIVPLEEPLLQKEVLNKLLPRLEAQFPARAKDLTSAYHDLLKGVDTNTVFGNAFKSLEELAREITGDKSLMLNKRPLLEKHFPNLHPIIRETIAKLADQRGDEGGHGRKGPDEWEIRYLLFMICNIALLLLEYREHCG